MKKFKNSKTAKVVSGFVGIATAIMMMGPGVASAAALTASQVSAIVSLLQSFGADSATISNVQASLNGQSTTGTSQTTTTSGTGYQFTMDLTVGSKGADVTALQQILVAKGLLTMPAGTAMGYFGGLTKSAVAAWQTSAGIAPAAGYVGPKSRAALNAMGGSSSSTTTTTTTTTTGTTLPVGCSSNVGFSAITGASCATGTVASGSGVSAMLDSSSPVASTLISGQGVATLAAFKISNGGSAAAKVTMLKFKRTGVSSDSTLNNVYLYDGAGSRLTDAASVATGKISFSDSAGLVTVPPMSSVVVKVRADLAGSTNGQTIGIMLTDMTADSGTVSGLPVSAAEMTIAAAPAGMSTAQFTSMTPNGGTVDPQNDYVVWQSNVTIGSRDALMSAIRFQQIGSVYSDDVQNFRLMVDGTQVGTAVVKADANRFVSFNFATPVTLKAGSHVVKMMADIISGSNRNFAFSLRRVVDVELWDSQLNVVVTPTVSVASPALTSFPVEGSAVSVTVGTLTITKDTSSPSGNVVINGSAVTLAKYQVKAQGEKIKVENLRVSHTASGATWQKIRNGALFLDGVQIGSTQDICEDTVNAACAVGYTQFNLGSSMVLEPGKTYILEVRGDVYNTNTASPLSAGTTTVVNVATGASNAYRMSSLSYFNSPSSVVPGSSLTVAAGSLVLAKYTAYANQTVTSPQTAYKLGEFRLTTGSTEGVNIDTFTLTHTGTITDLTNIYLVYGSKTSTIKAGSSSPMTWSVNEVLGSNTTMTVAVYGTIGSGITTGAFTGTLAVSGTSQSSGSAVTSASVAGQTVTIGTGSLTVAADASTPISAQVVSNSMPKVASWKFTSSNDAFSITELTATTSDASAISELVFKDGATELKRQSFGAANMATATGLSVPVAVNGTKVIDVYANLGSIGTGAGATGANVGVSLVALKYRNSNGVETATTSPNANGLNYQGAIVGNNQYAYKTKPTITNVALPTTVLSGGTPTIAQFTITADAAGTIAWRKLSINVATSTPSSSFTVTGYAIYDAANQSTALANVTASSSATLSRVDFNATVDQEISGSKTYVVKATVGGSLVSGASISTNIPSSGQNFVAPATSVGLVAAGNTTNFVWSDEAIAPHTSTTADWNNDYLVTNLPTDSQTLTK